MPISSKSVSITLDEVTSGMVIEFFYIKESGNSDTYRILVIDPNKKNKYTSEPQLHGYIIKDMSDTELLEFFSSFNENIKFDYENKEIGVVANLNTDEAYSIFASSNYVKDRSYRTFNLKNISQVRQVLLKSVK